MDFVAGDFLGNPISRWFSAVLLTLLLTVGLRIIVRIICVRLHRLAARTATQWDDLLAFVLARTRWFLIAVVALDLGSRLLILPERAATILRVVAVLSLLAQGGIWVSAALAFWLDHFGKSPGGEISARRTTMAAVAFVARLILWSVVGILALGNLGINITALVAGLGVGGIAVALAAQAVLGDLFASLAIALDAPFAQGDFLVVDGFMGTVERIGIKTTRLRSLSGEQIIFGNANLLGSRIRNFGRMRERRIEFHFQVDPQTPRAKLEAIPALVRAAVESIPKTRFDRCHWKGFDDGAFTFELVYFMETPDYNQYMDAQQSINLSLHRGFEAEAIRFAHPARVVYLARSDRGAVQRPADSPSGGDRG